MSILLQSIRGFFQSMHQYLGASLLVSTMAIVIYRNVEQFGWKTVLLDFVKMMQTEKKYQRIFLFFLYISMVVFKTILCRPYEKAPLGVVMGEWFQRNQWGWISAEPIGNIVLFVPLMPLLFAAFPHTIKRKNLNMIGFCVFALLFSILCSLSIEATQLILHSGTFQLSDIVFNTAGGLFGGVVFYVIYKIMKK